MNQHVDVVQNDWHSNLHICVARANLIEEEWIKIEEFWGSGWEPKVMQPYLDQTVGQTIDPEQSPKRFLEQLHTVLNGSSLFVTDLHDEAHCPFAARHEIPFREARFAPVSG